MVEEIILVDSNDSKVRSRQITWNKSKKHNDGKIHVREIAFSLDVTYATAFAIWPRIAHRSMILYTHKKLFFTNSILTIQNNWKHLFQNHGSSLR